MTRIRFNCRICGERQQHNIKQVGGRMCKKCAFKERMENSKSGRKLMAFLKSKAEERRALAALEVSA